VSIFSLAGAVFISVTAIYITKKLREPKSVELRDSYLVERKRVERFSKKCNSLENLLDVDAMFEASAAAIKSKPTSEQLERITEDFSTCLAVSEVALLHAGTDVMGEISGHIANGKCFISLVSADTYDAVKVDRFKRRLHQSGVALLLSARNDLDYETEIYAPVISESIQELKNRHIEDENK